MKIVSHNQFDLAEFALLRFRKLIEKIEIYHFLKDEKKGNFFKHHVYHSVKKDIAALVISFNLNLALIHVSTY